MIQVPSSIPAEAREIPVSSDETESTKVEYVLDGNVVGFRYIGEGGHIEWEQALRDGRPHGVERQFHHNGVLLFACPWVDGVEHGIARQYSESGELVCQYEMIHGTGVDLWCCNITDRLSEEHHKKDGRLHGVVRWWNDNEKTVWCEEWFSMSKRHGIWRSWNDRGRLSRGYPQYFVNDAKVTKRQYRKACETDPSLPPFREEENRPNRTLPPEFADRFRR